MPEPKLPHEDIRESIWMPKLERMKLVVGYTEATVLAIWKQAYEAGVQAEKARAADYVREAAQNAQFAQGSPEVVALLERIGTGLRKG